RLDPKEAATVCARAAEAMSDPHSLLALAQRMNPREAAAVLTRALSKSPASGTRQMAHGLSSVADRMEPGEAAGMIREVALSLFQTLSKTPGYADQQVVSRALSALLTGADEYAERRRAASVMAA